MNATRKLRSFFVTLLLVGSCLACSSTLRAFRPPKDRMMRKIKTTFFTDFTGKRMGMSNGIRYDISSIDDRDAIRMEIARKTVQYLNNFVEGFDVAELKAELEAKRPKSKRYADGFSFLTKDVQAFVNSIGGIDMDYVLKQDPAAARKSIQPAKVLFMLKSFLGFSASTREDYAAKVEEVLSNEAETLLPKLVGQGEEMGSVADTMELNRYALTRKRHYKFTTPGARDDLDSPGSGPVRGDSRSYIENLQMMKDMFEKGEVPDNMKTTSGYMKDQLDCITVDEATGKATLKPGVIFPTKDNGLMAQWSLDKKDMGGEEPYKAFDYQTGADLLAAKADLKALLDPKTPINEFQHKLGHARQLMMRVHYYEAPKEWMTPTRPGTVQQLTKSDLLPDHLKKPEGIEYEWIDIPYTMNLYGRIDDKQPDAAVPLEEQLKMFEKVVDAFDAPVQLPPYPHFPTLTPPGPPGVYTTRVVPGPVQP